MQKYALISVQANFLHTSFLVVSLVCRLFEAFHFCTQLIGLSPLPVVCHILIKLVPYFIPLSYHRGKYEGKVPRSDGGEMDMPVCDMIYVNG